MSVMAEKLPSLMIERPKMPRATWDALRAHIVRERQRKKHKLEQSAEVIKIIYFCQRSNLTHKYYIHFSKFHTSFFFSMNVRKNSKENTRKSKRHNHLRKQKNKLLNLRRIWPISKKTSMNYFTLWKKFYLRTIREGDPRRPLTPLNLNSICNLQFGLHTVVCTWNPTPSC